jgi:hypothetical protein
VYPTVDKDVHIVFTSCEVMAFLSIFCEKRTSSGLLISQTCNLRRDQ